MSAARPVEASATATSATAASLFMALELSPMADCLFCKIIERKIPSSVVYEDDRILAFNDIDPQAPTHVLIVPKRHIPTLNDLAVEDEQIVGELVRRAATIAKERGFSETGYRTLFNTNRGAGQSVFHIHVHLLGGRPFSWPP